MFGEFNIQNYRIYIVDNSGGEVVVYTREKPEISLGRVASKVKLKLLAKRRDKHQVVYSHLSWLS